MANSRTLPAPAPVAAPATINRAALQPHSLDGIEVSPFNSQGQKPRYIVKNPSGERHILTNVVGVKMLELIDGSRTSEQIRAAMVEQYNAKITLAQVESFLDLCHNNALLRPHSWSLPDGTPARTSSFRDRMGFYKRLVQGDRALDWLAAHRAWWLNPVTVLLGLALMVAGLLFAINPPPQAGLMAPFNQLELKPTDLLLTFIPLIFLVEISLHELAHGLSCRLFGARAGGFGFGLLWGVVPIFFTDTTDAYTIDSKYKRAMVSLAGPMVDLLFLGAFALLAWSAAEGSLLRQFAIGYTAMPLYMLLVNLNPFLIRMDGYWVASDLLEQPNLRRSTFRYLQRQLLRLLGRDKQANLLTDPADADPRTRLIYLTYGLVAILWTGAFVGSFLVAATQSILRLGTMLGWGG